MNCEACRELQIDYLEDELEPEPRRDVATHLATCSACAMQYCRLEADLNCIDSAIGEEPRSAVRAKLRDRVLEEFRESFWRRFFRLAARPVPVYQVALFVGVLVGGWALGSLLLAKSERPTTASSLSSTVRRFSSDKRIHGTLLDGYDAGEILRVSPDLL